MNFEIYSNTRFNIGVDIFNRLYYAIQKSNGKIKLINALDGSILRDNINPNEITIAGRPMKHLSELEAVIFNKNCTCNESLDNDEKRIFDQTFDKTFE